MFSALTEVLQKTLTSMGTQLHEHSKYQMELVYKLTEAVTQMILGCKEHCPPRKFW